MVEKSVFECDIWFSSYNDTGKKPLSLPCGHVYCTSCLIQLSTASGIVWPADKSLHKVQVSELPCCYAILINIPKSKPKEISCSKHPKKTIKFHCISHDKFLCSDWVIEHTGKGHEVVVHTPDYRLICKELDDLASKWGHSLQEAQDMKHNYVKNERSISGHYDQQITKINHSYDQQAQMLKQRRNQLINKVKSLRDEQMASVEMKQLQVLKSLDLLDKFTKQLESFRSERKPYEEIYNFIKHLQFEAKKFTAIGSDWKMNIQLYNFEGSNGMDIGRLVGKQHHHCTDRSQVKKQEKQVTKPYISEQENSPVKPGEKSGNNSSRNSRRKNSERYDLTQSVYAINRSNSSAYRLLSQNKSSELFQAPEKQKIEPHPPKLRHRGRHGRRRFIKKNNSF